MGNARLCVADGVLLGCLVGRAAANPPLPSSIPPPLLLLQGTVTHMSPSLLRSGKMSQDSDVYSFGIMMWELFTGGEGRMELAAHASSPARHLL